MTKKSINKSRRFQATFIHKIMGILLLAWLIMMGLMTLIFYNANQTLEKKVLENMIFSAREIRSNVDEVILNIYGVSDTFATEQRLLAYLDGSYEDNSLQKRQTTLWIMNRIFDGYNLLKRNEQIAAIYTYKDEVFNFMDPNHDGEALKEQLMAMEILDSSRLGKFYWYPLQENFLRLDTYDEIRKDQVIIGTRRVFSALKAQYAYVHIFALTEATLYHQYEHMVQPIGSEVYILSEQGALLSTSQTQWLKNPDRQDDILLKIFTQIANDDEPEGTIELIINQVPHYMVYTTSEVTGWHSIMLIPETSILSENQRLYAQVIWLMLIGVLLYTIILLYMYRSFMIPIHRLMKSMRKVHQGDLDQTISEEGEREIKKMIGQYNRMIKSIKYNIKERLESEQEKQRLEYQVLMSQVNPHFLYNTLESIVWMATEAGRPDIRRLAASLGRLYRLSVGDGEELVSISRELEHVTAYCHLQNNRYQDQVIFKMEANSGLVTQFETLKMILQPIVENCYTHALEGVHHVVTICIRMRVLEDRIQFYVLDNGCGLDDKQLTDIRKSLKDNVSNQRVGIGLGTVYKRLKLYDSNLGDLSIYSKQGKGTSVVIQIPKMNHKNKD